MRDNVAIAVAEREGLAWRAIRYTAEWRACRDEAERRLAEMTIAHVADRRVSQLPYGEQRRVLLARALATEAKVLLLDEPTSALDVAHVLALFATLRRLADDGHCVVIVLHQLDDALRFSDRALLLDRGRAVASGTAESVITVENVLRVYGVELVPGGALGFRPAERPT